MKLLALILLIVAGNWLSFQFLKGIAMGNYDTYKGREKPDWVGGDNANWNKEFYETLPHFR